jgi:alkylation response protein AidB-like acyl-CoA dehydrogenase
MSPEELIGLRNGAGPPDSLRSPLDHAHWDGAGPSDSLRSPLDHAHWDPQMPLRGWWQLLADAGLAFPSWRIGCGGIGADDQVARTTSRTLGALLSNHSMIGPPPGLGTLMGGPVVMQFGNDEQQRRLLPPLANGTEGWCQLFSEPGAGSDLASVATTAVRDGDEWIVTGQKVWTSGAAHSRRGMLIARTDWDQPKHRGLTYFIIDLQQPGVELRPLKQMNGKSHFFEVFLNEVRIADSDRIGEINEGWRVAVATLGYERSGLSANAYGGVSIDAGELVGNLDAAVGTLVARSHENGAPEDETAPGSFDFLSDLAARIDRNSPMIRSKLTALYVHERIAGMSQQRTTSPLVGSGQKLWWTNGLRMSRDVGLEILGPHGMLAGPASETEGRVQTFALSVPSASIAGGSDEVQRNIIGERVLGLPKEPSVDTDIAFREVRRS